MQENITSESLFCDYYAQWVRTYKEGAIRDVTMGKYRLTQSWLGKLIPELRLADMDRTAYQQLINGYAQHHERQTTMDFHHQIKGAILDAVDEGLIPRDPTRKVIIKGKQPRIKKMKYLNQFELHAMLADLDLGAEASWDWLILLIAKTGLRFSEALGLTPDDFDFTHQTLSVSKTWDYKNGGGFVPTKTNPPYAKCSLTGSSSCSFPDYSRIFRMTSPSSCTAKSITPQPTAYSPDTARTWMRRSFPSTDCGIRTHHYCCSPAYQSPACRAALATPA